LAGQDVGQESVPLLVGAVRHDGGTGHADPDEPDVLGRFGPSQLLEDDGGERDGGLAPAVRLGPVQADVPGLVQLPGPILVEGDPSLALGLAPLRRAPPVGEVRGEPSAELRPERGLLRSVAKIHVRIMHGMPSIGEVLDRAEAALKASDAVEHPHAGKERYDAEELLEWIVGPDWEPDEALSRQRLRRFDRLLARRLAGEPPAYITGRATF